MGLLSLAGCNQGPGRIPGVDVSVERVAENIVHEYDKDGSGTLSQKELASVPAVEVNRSWYDVDHDGEISTSELRAGLAVIFDAKIGLLSAWCNVSRNGRPLPGALVEFVPLPELQGAVPPASATTDDQGIAKMAVADDDLPANSPRSLSLVRPGLYLVKVTHPTISIPPKYNTDTTLGKEISNHSTASGPLKINLKF